VLTPMRSCVKINVSLSPCLCGETFLNLPSVVISSANVCEHPLPADSQQAFNFNYIGWILESSDSLHSPSFVCGHNLAVGMLPASLCAAILLNFLSSKSYINNLSAIESSPSSLLGSSPGEHHLRIYVGI
jgi:hypothetical protein